MQGLKSLTWLLPLGTLAFVVYLTGALVSGLVFDVPLVLILIPSIPAIGLTWLGLVVAFMDVSERAKDGLSLESQVAWLLALAILNVFALLPYWLFVIRRDRRPAS